MNSIEKKIQNPVVVTIDSRMIFNFSVQVTKEETNEYFENSAAHALMSIMC